jgi:hypothetical protein
MHQSLSSLLLLPHKRALASPSLRVVIMVLSSFLLRMSTLASLARETLHTRQGQGQTKVSACCVSCHIKQNKLRHRRSVFVAIIVVPPFRRSAEFRPRQRTLAPSSTDLAHISWSEEWPHVSCGTKKKWQPQMMWLPNTVENMQLLWLLK